MPLYEYRCDACQAEFELQVSFAKADAAECPECGSQEVTRLVSTFSACGAGGGSQASAAACFTGG